MTHTVAIIGAGSLGIATAFYLARNHDITDIVLIEKCQPMAYTSAQSGENYRNWWPNKNLMDMSDRSIDLMETLARESGNRFSMTRRGYLLATRSPDANRLLKPIEQSTGVAASSQVRIRDSRSHEPYANSLTADWARAPGGFDLLTDQRLIQSFYPGLDAEVRNILHVRRGGDISGQQLGQYMLEYIRSRGGRLVTGTVADIKARAGYVLEVIKDEQRIGIEAKYLVNAAGPLAGEIAGMLDVTLPIHNVLQQKIAFPDTAHAIPRDQPFTIDIDKQAIDWTPQDRALLRQDPEFAWLAEPMPGGIHCKPDGGPGSDRVKLGWAYNTRQAPVSWDVPLDDHFPEIVLHGAARLNPALKAYYEALPSGLHHYGGWYTRTNDNLPLIGPMGPAGAYMVCALSGHGTMAACAAGELAAAWVSDQPRPAYATAFSLARYQNRAGEQAEQQAEETGLL